MTETKTKIDTAAQNKFQSALALANTTRPPVWFMRQAGRYHSHYQSLRKKHRFEELCQNPDLACEVTMGPINDFDFDAAILFSDILFPIEAMGVPLRFDPAPRFDHYLKTPADLDLYQGGADKAEFMQFQAQALRSIRHALPQSKGLIGFVGGLLTLYIFAVDGSHKVDLTSSRHGLTDGRFHGFMEKMLPTLVANMVLQAKENIDCLAIMDSAAGEISFPEFRDLYMPWVRLLLTEFRRQCPDTAILYYAKHIDFSHWELLSTLPIQAMGVAHDLDMREMMHRYGKDFALQGNFAPENMTLPQPEFQQKMDHFFRDIETVAPENRKGWICGLGHGITPKAKEENVRLFLKRLKEIFGDI